MIIKEENLRKIVERIFKKIGCNSHEATLAADVLVEADLRNISSHGVLRVPDYFALWKAGRVNATSELIVEHETLSTAVVDGDRGLGVVVTPKAMQIAISKAEKCGTGWVAVNNSNHFGIAGYHALLAAKQDMIGIVMTNANPLVAPTFSKDRLLGTNPIAVAIPVKDKEPFLADFATTGIARGKLVVLENDNKQAPDNMLQDKDGIPTTNPSILKDGGALRPLGGDRAHSSHKGYCLGSVVDIFSALLSGAQFGPWVPPSVSYLPVKQHQGAKGTGHFVGAIRIDAFQTKEIFYNRMTEWIDTFKHAAPIEGQNRVYIPGEIEYEARLNNLKNGIVIQIPVWEKLMQIADELNVVVDC